jgi:hypothetical protein
MDRVPGQDDPGGGPQGPTDWVAEFRRQAEAVRVAADEWAIRWHEPEGRFISAMLGLMESQARLVISAQASLQQTMQRGQQLAEVEFATARKLKESIEALSAQTRNVHLLSVVEQENMAQRMIQETLPLFASSLKGALVIRESAWNQGQQRRRYGAAGVLFLAVFAAGYALSAWSRQDAVAAMDRCMRAMVQANGHTYCLVDLAMAPSAAPAPSGRQ